MSKPLCLVTGATGAVGPTLVKELAAQGYQVRALARRLPPAGLFPNRVEVLVGDLCDRDDVRRALAGAELVFHLAARLHIANPTEQMRSEYESTNVGGTRILAEEARAARIRRLVYFSTVSVYGATGTRPVDETASPAPDTIYAETKLRAEEAVLSARDIVSGQPLGVVLRMAAVYGPGMKGNYVSLARALAKGRFIPLGNGSNLRTLIYVEDAVRAAILVTEHPRAAGQIYNVSDGDVHSLRDIISAISLALGKRPPRLAAPVIPARLAAAVLDSALGITGRRKRFGPAIDKLTESVAVSSHRIRHDLGFAPRYNLDGGWKETITALTPTLDRNH